MYVAGKCSRAKFINTYMALLYKAAYDNMVECLVLELVAQIRSSVGAKVFSIFQLLQTHIHTKEP